MNKFIICIGFLLLSSLSYSQGVENELENAQKELSRVKVQLDSLNTLEKFLKKKCDSLKVIQYNTGDTYVLKWDYYKIKKGEPVKIVEAGNEWTFVSTAILASYKVPSYYLDNGAGYQKLEQERVERINKKKRELIAKFGETNATKIIDNRIWIGMTDKMAIESWGKPIEVNRTVGDWGVHEQWVYSAKRYLYFENDILKSWQD